MQKYKVLKDLIEFNTIKDKENKEIKTANFMTEASKINGAKRIILGTGPVTAHEANENIPEKSYKKLIEQYKELIYKFCN